MTAGQPSGAQVVALGGGHGLAASLQALTRVTSALTAVVTVADDGGSSGRLREELDLLPPGDLRMALCALAAGDGWARSWQTLLQHRFPGRGPLAGHAVGNLLLAGLADTEGGMVEALELVGQLIGARGRVLPASLVPLRIVAQVLGANLRDPGAVSRVVGQVAVATTPGVVMSVSLEPEQPPACEQAVAAVLAADVVVLGPGSWFTSVLPHLLVPGLRDALVRTAATRVVVLNLAEQTGETAGYSPQAHLEVLAAHAGDLVPDVVLADEQAVLDTRGLMSAVEAAGGRLVLCPIALGDGTPRHDPVRLAAAYQLILSDLTQTRGPAWR